MRNKLPRSLPIENKGADKPAGKADVKSGFVAVVGRPNAGKSTLVNRILGAELSIVTPKAQTTREQVLGILNETQGQIVFVDTPGIHRAKEGGINAYMVDQARAALEAPNAVWYLLDPFSALSHEKAVVDLLASRPGSPVFLLINKSDLVSGARREAALALAAEVKKALLEAGLEVKGEPRLISAEKGKGVLDLLDETWALLPAGPLYFPDVDQISDRPTRYFVGEKIREQLLMKLGQELPYSCAVEIEKFDEQAKPVRIEAVIYVERESQKGMVIGKGGSKIKEIGQAARAQIDEFIGSDTESPGSGGVFLGLKVKVLKDWSRDSETLRKMGYSLPKLAPQPRPRDTKNRGGA